MYERVAKEAEVPAVGGLAVAVGGKTLALFRSADGILAVDNACPHAGGPLAEGTCEDGAVTCPWHAWRFDLATGACLGRPGRGLAVYPVRVEAGEVLLDLSAAAAAPER